jgi:type IV pilus assembly protein PilY1
MMKTSVGHRVRGDHSATTTSAIVRCRRPAPEGTIDLKPADFSGTARASWYTTLYAPPPPVDADPHGDGQRRPHVRQPGALQLAARAGSGAVSLPAELHLPDHRRLLERQLDRQRGQQRRPAEQRPKRASASPRAAASIRPRSPSNSLADVALYWYNGGSARPLTSLRPSLEPDWTKPGLVPAGDGENTHLHMNTYTLGLGVDGVMTYEDNYDTAPKTGRRLLQPDHRRDHRLPMERQRRLRVAGSEGERHRQHRPVAGGRPVARRHQRPRQVLQRLRSEAGGRRPELGAVEHAGAVGAAAAAATSTPNISQQDNDIFSDTFTTVKWYGELTNRKIDIRSPATSAPPVWNSSNTVGRKVDADGDDRTILMLDPAEQQALKQFPLRRSMTALEKAWFDNKCARWRNARCLSAADRAIVNNGANIVNWLRGQQQYAERHHVARLFADPDPPGSTRCRSCWATSPRPSRPTCATRARATRPPATPRLQGTTTEARAGHRVHGRQRRHAACLQCRPPARSCGPMCRASR